MNINNSLDSKVFQDKTDFKVFESILECLDNVIPKKVSRQEFNEMKGNFLVETGENRFDLFLPDDLKVFELPAIISRVNKLTFGEIIPDYASKEELKIKIVITLNNLLQVLSERTLNKKEKEDIQIAIKKYVRLFEDMYGVSESQNLSNENYRNGVIEKSKISQSNERFIEYQKKLEKIKTKESLDELLNEVELSMTKEVEEHFEESFFERGINMLRVGMMTITKAEREAKIRYCEENGYEKSVGSNGNITYKKLGDVFSLGNGKDLDEQERLLRDKIGIDELKAEIERYRKNGNDSMRIICEYYAMEKILKVLQGYFYIFNESDNGYKASKIKDTKEIYCLGFSLLGHAFLSELGIKHTGVSLPKHSRLNVFIGGSVYNFDATSDLKAVNITNQEPEEGYSEGNPEKILLSQICNNRGAELLGSLGKSYGDIIKILRKSSNLDTNNISTYKALGILLGINGEYEEAVLMMNKVIELEPNNDDNFYEKGFILEKSKSYVKAIEYYIGALKLNPKNIKALNRIGIILRTLGENIEAIKQFNKAIEIEPSNYEAYLEKSYSLKDLGKNKTSKLYFYTGNLLNGKEDFIDIFNRKEKSEIKRLITLKNFEGLRLYLLELERQEN